VCVYTSLTDFEYGRALCVRGASLWHRFSNRDSYNCTGTKPIETVALSKQSLIDRFLFCLLLVLYVYLSREYTPRHVINLWSQLVCVLYLGVTRKRERERERGVNPPTFRDSRSRRYAVTLVPSFLKWLLFVLWFYGLAPDRKWRVHDSCYPTTCLTRIPPCYRFLRLTGTKQTKTEFYPEKLTSFKMPQY
jgi:hypothetical protein